MGIELVALLRRVRGGRGRRQDHVGLAPHELGSQGGQPIGMPVGVAPLDRDVFPFDVAEIVQSPKKRSLSPLH